MVLERIDSPRDLRGLSRGEVDVLAGEIRELLIATCATNGGHLAPNLGVVELTLALHRVLDMPPDKIVWDVSHQAYVHKILTGRRDRFATLRKGGGISGFTMRSESEYDVFGAGHASTAVSAGLGMVKARDLAARHETIVSVIGDGALTGGLAYEALNNAGQLDTNFIVVLNDNEMSIAPNVGSIAKNLAVLRSKPLFNTARETTKNLLGAIPFGDRALKALSTAEVATMRFWSPEEKATVIFEEMGFRYIGPIDGHDYDTLIDVISNARKIAGPVLLHVRTIKGKGFTPAEVDARTFHGVGANAYSPDEGKLEKKGPAQQTFSSAFAAAMIQVARREPRLIGITAAMPDGTGLAAFGQQFPDRYFDVGIAEGHAVCFAAGAATSGLRPVCAIYSTFLQRAYDQIVHDVCVQNLPVVFAVDRAGLVGDDGPTHMGLYDIAYLRALPNMTLMAPRCEAEVQPMLEHALSLAAPVALRYPRGGSTGKHTDAVAPIEYGRAEVLRRGSDVALFAYGHTVDAALDAADLLAAEGVQVTVVNARFAKPLDTALLDELGRDHGTLVTIEDHALAGGFGAAVAEVLADRRSSLALERVGVADQLVQHDSPARQRAAFGLTGEAIAARVRAARVARAPVA